MKKIVTTRSGTIQNRAYCYTDAGNIERIIDHKAGITYDYGYDNLHRLVSEDSYVTGAYPAINYTYNAIGNMTSRKVGSTVYTYSYNDPSHKHAVSMINVNSQNHSFAYDANGNMTTGKDLTNLGAIATRTIQWNADNMPVSINHSMNGQTTFTYDGNNTRVKKAHGNTETFYFGPAFEMKKQGTSTDYLIYIFAGNLRVAKVSSENGTFYFHKDHLGSSTAMTSSAGAEAETTEYLPFGSQRAHTGSTISDYKFTDQELEPESGLYNYKARLYDAVIGRFISPDPIVPYNFEPQSLNRYSYCRNNPLIYVDPTGNFDLGQFALGLVQGIDACTIAGIGITATALATTANPGLGLVAFLAYSPAFYTAYVEAKHAYHNIIESFKTNDSIENETIDNEESVTVGEDDSSAYDISSNPGGAEEVGVLGGDGTEGGEFSGDTGGINIDNIAGPGCWI